VSDAPPLELTCPLPFAGYERVVMAHGAGGRVMHRLIADLFLRAFDNPALRAGHDGAVIDVTGPVALTTDGFVVSPRFFPGGDIGSLSVYGTVNDLAVCGARPVALTAGFILEEGLPLEELARIVASMAAAARRAGVVIATGDTKVVERGQADGLFITTAGLGEVVAPSPVRPSAIRPGDVILCSGPVGDHGVAVMAAREGLTFAEPVLSDAGPVHEPILALFAAGIGVTCLRDPTRGGVAAALGEVAEASGLGMRLAAGDIPVRPAVADACELLGLDPLHVACEGRFLAWVEAARAEEAVAVLRAHGAPEARRVGEVTTRDPGVVVLVTELGGERVLDVPAGAPLPRIC